MWCVSIQGEQYILNRNNIFWAPKYTEDNINYVVNKVLKFIQLVVIYNMINGMGTIFKHNLKIKM